MLELDGLKAWFEDNANRVNTDKQGCYWVLKRNGTKTVFNNTEVGELTPSWEMLERYVYDQARQGARSLNVQFRMNPKDRYGYDYEVHIPYSANPAPQPAAVSGLPGTPGTAPAAFPGIGQLYEARMEERVQAMQDRYEAKLEAIKAQHENEKRLNELEDHIVALAESKKTSFDKLIEALEERPQVVDKLLGAVTPAVQGFLSRLTPAQAQIAVHGTPAGVNVPPPQSAAPQDDAEGEEESGIDFNPAIQATAVLAQAGFPHPELVISSLADSAIRFSQAGFSNPAELITSLVQFAETNPEMARGMLKQLSN